MESQVSTFLETVDAVLAASPRPTQTEGLLIGALLAILLRAILSIRAVALVVLVMLACAAVWALFVSPSGPAAHADALAARLIGIAESGIVLGAAVANLVASLIGKLTQPLRGRRRRGRQ